VSPARRSLSTATEPVTPGPSRSRVDFHAHAGQVLERLRTAVARLVEAAPGGADRATDLRRALDLDAALAWQVHTIATASDLLRAARVIPKAGAMDRLFRSARAHSIEPGLVSDVAAAYGDFERLVGEHAGDRETFDAIVAALRPDDAAALQKIRRAAFKANAATWGLAVRCMLNCVVFRQRPGGEHDCLSIRARIGVRCLHEGATIGIYASARTWGGSTCPPEGAPRVAIDTGELLNECCSRPTPPIERIRMPDGSVRDFIRLEGVGRSSETTLYWRALSLDFPDGTTAPPHGCSSPCLEPAELSVVDLLVPRGWTDPRTATALVTGSGAPVPVPGPGLLGRSLPFEGKAEHLGTSLDRLHTRQAPGYPGIVRAQLARVGWDSTEFDIFRCVVRYPMFHASVHLFVPGAPGG
jgi:hypothetical protein